MLNDLQGCQLPSQAKVRAGRAAIHSQPARSGIDNPCGLPVVLRSPEVLVEPKSSVSRTSDEVILLVLWQVLLIGAW